MMKNLKKILRKENWKDIPGYEGFYQVSDKGNIRSLERTVVKKNGRIQSIKERILTPFLLGPEHKKYKSVNLCKNGKWKTIQIHKLVAMAFLNHKPNGYKIVVDHINNNPLENNIENLQLISHRENCSKNRTGGTSKYIGVSWNKNSKKWQSAIIINGKTTNLGLYEDEYEAHLAYQNKLKEII